MSRKNEYSRNLYWYFVSGNFDLGMEKSWNFFLRFLWELYCLAGLLKKCVLSQSYWVYQTQTKQMQHFGFTRLTKSCVTYDRSEPVSNITVASVTP